MTTPTQTRAIDFAAALLGRILRDEGGISPDDLLSNRKLSSEIINSLLKSHKTDGTVTIEFRGNRFRGSVGLTDSAVRKLEDAIKEL